MQAEAKGHRVLLVGSDESLCRALERAMRLAGYTVTSFASVDEMLAGADTSGAACLVLDVDAPHGGRINPGAALRGKACARRSIFITAAGRDERDAQFGDLAPLTVLHKPFDRTDLLDALALAFAAAPDQSGPTSP